MVVMSFTFRGIWVRNQCIGAHEDFRRLAGGSFEVASENDDALEVGTFTFRTYLLRCFQTCCAVVILAERV